MAIKRGKKASIIMFAVTVIVMFILTGCSTVKAAATEEDVRVCKLKPGKDVFALGEATILLSNPNLDVMKAAGWTVDDSVVRPMLKDIHDVDLSKDNCVLYRVGSYEPGAPALASRWFGYCMSWAVHIPYQGGDWVMFSTFKRHPEEAQATEEFACVLNDGSEAIRKRYQVQP